jgi:hypothetical protein
MGIEVAFDLGFGFGFGFGFGCGCLVAADVRGVA